MDFPNIRAVSQSDSYTSITQNYQTFSKVLISITLWSFMIRKLENPWETTDLGWTTNLRNMPTLEIEPGLQR